MNIVLNYDPVAAANPSFVADAQRAVTILNSTFTNNITLKFDIGLGSLLQWDNPSQSYVRKSVAPGGGAANINFDREVSLTYSELRTDLLTFGQPNFFTPTNLPAGNSINNISNFFISSSVAAAFGLPVPNPINRPGVDGFVGIGTGTSGPARVDTILHEIGHAMGRISTNYGPNVSELDLM